MADTQIVLQSVQSAVEPSLLEPGRSVERELLPGQSHHYRFEPDIGQFARVELEKESADFELIVFGPDGGNIAEAKGAQPGEPLGLLLVAKVAGSHRLEVRSVAKAGSPARYKLTLAELREATERDRNHVAGAKLYTKAMRLRLEGTPQSMRQSIEKFEAALPFFRAGGERKSEADTLATAGYVCAQLGEHQRALDYYREALPLYRDLGDRRSEMTLINNMARIYAILDDFGKALELYRQALELSRALDDRRFEASALSSLGAIHNLMGEYQISLESYHRALAIYRASKDRRGEAMTLNSLGQVYKSLGDHQKALDYYGQALPLYRAVADRNGEAAAIANLASVYISLEEYTRALESYNQALVLLRAAGNRRGEGSVLNGIAAAYTALNEYQKALDIYHQSLPLARATGNRRGEAAVLNNLGRTYFSLGDYPKALDLHRQALALIRAAGDRRGEAQMLFNLARVHRARGDLAAAFSRIEEAIDLVESMRDEVPGQEQRASLFAAVRNFFELKIDLQMQRDRLNPSGEMVAAALETSERARARSLLELLAEARVDMRQDIKLAQPQPLSAREVQQQIPDGETLLLEYALGDERSYMWAVRGDSITGYELPKRSEIEAAARKFYDLLKKADAGKARLAEAGAELSRMLLAPISDRLRGNRLVIVPDGILHYIPFSALPAPGNPKSLTPLLVDHEVVMLPSASVLAELRRDLAGRKPAPKAVAVFADPVFSRNDPRIRLAGRASKTETQMPAPDLERAMRDIEPTGSGSGFPRLPFSRREAEAIIAVAPPRQWSRALDFHASRAAAIDHELSNYRIIHFATHGLLNSRHPELSGIVLSLVDRNGQSQNGFLRLHEIYNLRLPAELVVLSACQTALGKEIYGEGLVGLTRGFMFAGAPRVVASLWKVDDAATAELMKRFYRGMFDKGLRPAAALRAAQVEMWRQDRFNAPYFWAAFVLQGEWR